MDGRAFTVETLAPRQLTCLRQFSNRPATVPAGFTSQSNTIRLSERHYKWVPPGLLLVSKVYLRSLHCKEWAHLSSS